MLFFPLGKSLVRRRTLRAVFSDDASPTVCVSLSLCSSQMGKQRKNSNHKRPSPLTTSSKVSETLLPTGRRLFNIAKSVIAWRFVVVWMVEVFKFSSAETAKKVGKRASEVIKWCNRFWTEGSFDDLVRSGRPKVISEADINEVKDFLTSAPPGTSIKVCMQKLRSEKKIGSDFTDEAMRLALGNSGWSFQRVKVRLPLSVDTMDKRWEFGVKYHGVGLGARAVFTDSKYFVAGSVNVATKNAGMMSWAPDGERRTVIKTQGNTYSAHVYGGICKYGLTDLAIVSGTRGLPSAYSVERKNPKYDKGDPNNKESEFISQEVTAVTNMEYRDILMGGGPRRYKGLIKDAKRMFQSNGEQNWYWQQEGAPVHTMKDTEKGRPTLALIQSVTKNIVEWPPYSPDLSPIENVWQHVERVMWRDESWDDQQSFQKALLKTWKAVGNDKAFIKNVMASVDRRSKDGDDGGRIMQVIARQGGQTDF